MEKLQNPVETTKQHRTPTISTVLSDGTLVEMLYSPEIKHCRFVSYQNEEWRYEERLHVGEGQVLIPYSPDNNLLKHDVVLFPSEVEEYESEERLVSDVQSFIHRYVDLDPMFEKIASYYVLFTWVYDGFNELPYLRVRADFGSGKTRFLLTFGSVCYKPIFASGASTISPLFASSMHSVERSSLTSVTSASAMNARRS